MPFYGGGQDTCIDCGIFNLCTDSGSGLFCQGERYSEGHFGSYEDYVLPVQDLRTPGDLMEKFRWIMDHENEIRTYLQGFMPGYIARAWEAGEALKQI